MKNKSIFKKAGIDLRAFPSTMDAVMVAGKLATNHLDAPNRANLTPFQRARLGKITGSQFNRIKRGQGGKGWSEGAETYLAELVWEWITGIPAIEFSGSAHTEWGHKYEGEAIEIYEKKSGHKVKRGKFYSAPQFSGLVGCTPDGIGEGALEVKCPYAPKAHIMTLISQSVPSEYLEQVHGHMLCASRDWCHFVSYDPRFRGHRDDLALIIIEVEANSFFMEDLECRLHDFEGELITRLDKLEIDWQLKQVQP